ncbi:MAG: PH domain-containing protein [Arenimonas sp.]
MNNKEEMLAANIAASSEQLRRLHPLSWLFVLVLQLRQFAFPLIILLFTGRGDRYELWSLVGVAALAIYSVFQYFTYRYRVLNDELIVRSGVFQKSVRHIPFSRIQNVSITQNVLHRLFNVAEVKLEAAGGVKPEAQMRVLSLADAQELEELIRSHAMVAQMTTTTIDVPGSGLETLHQLSVIDVVKLGLINNRGMLVIGAAVGFSFQGAGDATGNLINTGVKFLFGWSDSLHLGASATALSIALAIAVFLILVRLFSVLIALLQYYGFSLSQLGRRLTVQRGLLSRLRSSLPLRRIQAYSLSEGWLHRRFNKRSLKVDSAAGVAMNEENKSPLRDLVPLAEPKEMDALIARFLASEQWPIQSWHSLHKAAWQREFMFPAVFVSAAGIVGAFFYPVYAAISVVLIIPVLFLRAKVWSAHAAFAHTDHLIAIREGWLSREWRFAEISKLQGLSLREGILDRRYGMASLYLDTAGAQAMSSAFRIPYLPREQANILMAQLSTKISRGPLPF